MKNPKVVFLSIIGLACIVLTFTVSYWFIAGAVVVMLINQRELMRKKE